MLALMFSLVFVSVKLSGEHGTHLSPSLGENPSWLMAFPRNHKVATGWFSGFQIHLPGTPRTPLLPRRGEWVASAPGPIPGSTWTWNWWGWPSSWSPLQELSHTWFVAFLTPIGKTKQPFTLSQSFIGLIQTKPPQAFVFLSFITFILIWTRSLDFKVAWLYCCQFNVSLHSNSQPVNVTHILLD